MDDNSLKPMRSGTVGRPGTGASLPRVRAVSRAIAIMRAFTASQPFLSLSEVAAIAELDAGTTRRILVTLRDEGIITQNPQTGRYNLTMQAMRFASAVPDGQSLRDMAEDQMNQLAHQIGATVLLSVLRGNEAVCLARFHGDAPVQVRWWSVGGGLPLNCGAAPRLLLAHMPLDACEDYLGRGPLPALTARSMTDPDMIRAEVDRIREQGWSYATDDVAEGLSALAGPVRDDTGTVVGAISIGGLTPTIGDPNAMEGPPASLKALLACCERVSTRLAAQGFKA